MGRYPDTNNQFAYRTNRDAFLQGIADRAENLWRDGYRVAPLQNGPTCFLVYREEEATGYCVDPVAQTCSCRFHTDQKEHPLTDDGSLVPCKHLQGLAWLVSEEVAYWQMRRDVAEQKASPTNGSAERAAEYALLADALIDTWKRVERACRKAAA
jgi:hypothetical protein